MGELAGTVFVVIYLAAVFLATVFIVMAFVRGLRRARGGLEFKPIPAIFPPVPVEPTLGVSVVGWLGVVWSLGHLGAVGLWGATSYLVPRTAPTVIAATYTAFAALLVGIGAVMLLRRGPFGRTLIAWGMALLALLTFYALIISFLLPSLEGVKPEVRRMGRVIGTFVAAQLIFDTLVGALGQRVGRPAGWSEEKELLREEEPPGEVLPTWDDPDVER